MNTIGNRIETKAVATYLGVDRTTVYALIKGVRGWSRIPPLPYHIKPRKHAKTQGKPRDHFEFVLSEIDEWKEKTGFTPNPRGRRIKQPAVEQAVAAC